MGFGRLSDGKYGIWMVGWFGEFICINERVNGGIRLWIGEEN